MIRFKKEIHILAIVTLINALALALSYVHVTAAATSPLGTLAASMAPGSWVPLGTGNIDATLLDTGADGNALGYTYDITYDPVSQKFFYLGGDHNALSIFASYDSLTNTWQQLPRPSWMPTPSDYLNGSLHAYDQSALDPVRGYFYHRPNNGTFDVHRYNIATQTWDSPAVPARPTSSPFGGYSNCCDALEYFPELGGLVWIAGDGLPGQNTGHVYLLSDSTNQWTVLSSSVDLAGTWQSAEYNPVYKVLIFYSAGTNKFYKLDSSGAITAIANPPFTMYDGSSYVATLTVDPVSGQYLALSAGSRQFYTYDVPSNTWHAQASTNKPDLSGQAVVTVPVSDYGVTFFTACKTAGAGCQVYLYKHQASSVVVDSTPPAVSLSAPASGSAVSGTVTVSANASDNVGVTGVQFKLDGNNLGSEDTGSPYSATWNTTTAVNGSHTLSAVARDAAGNQTTSLAITISVNNAATNGSNFADRCAAPGVVKCVGFDQASDIAGGYGSNSGIFSGATTPQLDTAVAASGGSSIKFTVPSNSDADTSGSYFTNFSSDLSVQFGQGEEFYAQWRQRFSPEFLNTYFQGGGGWKQAIIGEGDRPGVWNASCTQLEIVTQNTFQRGYAQNYHSCGGKDSHYEPLEEHYGPYDFKLQNARPSPYCLYSQGNTSPVTSFPPVGNCFGYFPNEWMTFQVHVKIGTWYLNDGNYHHNSAIELWIAREGQPSQLVNSWTTYDIANNNPAAKYGKIWLLPYHTGKDSSQSHPTGYVWYDDLIISRNKIADPTTGSGTTDPTPPAVSMTAPASGATVSGTAVTVSATASDNVGVAGVQFKLDGANLDVEDTSAPFSISWNTVSASNGSHSLTAVARDAAGNQTISSAITVTVNNVVPGAFVKSTPANTATGQTLSPTLVWGAASGATSYEYCVDTINNNVCDTSWTSTTSTSAGIGGLNAGTLYFWQVRTRNAAGIIDSDIGAWWSFTTSFVGHVNVAAAANGATASASSFYNADFAPSGAIDGDHKGTAWGSGGGWNDSTVNAFPDWLQVDFAGSRTINEVDVFTVQDVHTSPVEPAPGLQFSLYGVTTFQVQYWDGFSWVVVPGGSITANNQVWRQITFGAITTPRIRIYVTGALNGYSRLVEVEAYSDVTIVPSSLMKSSPANSATGQVLGPTLSWGSASGATSYDYCVDTINNNSCDTGWKSTVSSSAVPDGLNPGTTYWWQVRARNAIGTTEADSGTWWSFPTVLHSLVNVAAAAHGASVFASSFYNANFAPSSVVDGDRKGLAWGHGGGWNDGTEDVFPDWLQINFAGARNINEIDIFTVQDNSSAPVDPTPSMTFSQYGITSFIVQYWNGKSWVNVPNGNVSGNTLVWQKINFPALTTTSILVYVTGTLNSWSRITEIEAY